MQGKVAGWTGKSDGAFEVRYIFVTKLLLYEVNDESNTYLFLGEVPFSLFTEVKVFQRGILTPVRFLLRANHLHLSHNY